MAEQVRPFMRDNYQRILEVTQNAFDEAWIRKDMAENVSVQSDPNPHKRLQVGSCEWVNCGRPAFFEVKLDCDDETIQLCEPHFDGLVALLRPWIPNLFKHDGEDDE